MRVDEIALLRSAGDISGCRIVPGDVRGKWMIEFKRKGGEIIPLTAQRNNVRQFSSVDSALKVLVTLGFKNAKLDWSTLEPLSS